MIQPIQGHFVLNLLITLLTVLRAYRAQQINLAIESEIMDLNLSPNYRLIMSLINLLISIKSFLMRNRKEKLKPLAKPHKLIRLLHGYR